MAKKKSNKKEKAPKTQRRLPTKEGRKIDNKKKSMKEKIEIKKPDGIDKASKIVGTIFIGLGILLVAFGVYSFLKFRSEPTYNEQLDIPTMEYVTDLTNGEEITVKGKAKDHNWVAVFVNDERVGETRVKKDDIYEYSYKVEDEGEYAVSVAGLKGFPFREISARSESELAVVDRTAPESEDIKLEYAKETTQSIYSLTGRTEPNTKIEVTRGVSTYEVTADENGDFKIEGIALDEGKNVFYVTLIDQAGNEISLDEKIRIAYSPQADLNGDGVSDSQVAGTDDQLPQADGELDNLLARNLMLIFAIAAIFVFSGSSIYAFSKRK
jgi:hypothetical protein